LGLIEKRVFEKPMVEHLLDEIESCPTTPDKTLQYYRRGNQTAWRYKDYQN
jgi:hypothetical protein